MFEKCYLHVGQPKTGSTSIQYSFHRNRDLLESHGLHYPAAAQNHVLLGATTYEKPTPNLHFQRQGRTTDDLRTEAAKLAATVKRDAGKSRAQALMLSSESFFNLPPENLRRLLGFAGSLAREVFVVCYVRHPALQAASAMQQRVKMGYRRLTADLEDPGPAVLEKLADLRDAAGADRLVLRAFDRQTLAHGDVVDDMLAVVGLSHLTDNGFVHETHNESISHEALLLADAANRILPARVNGEANLDRAANVYRFFYAIRGERYALPLDRMDDLLRRTAPSVEALSRDYGLTFPVPRSAGSEARWDGAVLEDIMREVNALMLANQALKKELAALKRKPRRRWWRRLGLR